MNTIQFRSRRCIHSFYIYIYIIKYKIWEQRKKIRVSFDFVKKKIIRIFLFSRPPLSLSYEARLGHVLVYDVDVVRHCLVQPVLLVPPDALHERFQLVRQHREGLETSSG